MNRRIVLPYTVLGILLYAIFLLATAPASWMAKLLTSTSRGILLVEQPRGGFWNGEARLVFSPPGAPPVRAGKLSWDIQGLWLILGQVRAKLQVSGAGVDGTATAAAAPYGYSLRDLDLRMAADDVSTFIPVASLLGPQGTLRLRASVLDLGSSGVEGNAELVWENALLRPAGNAVLGDYRFGLNGHGKSVTLKLETLRGTLDASGQGEWRGETGMLNFNGALKPRVRTPQMDSMLTLVGEDRGNGERLLAYNGPTPFILR